MPAHQSQRIIRAFVDESIFTDPDLILAGAVVFEDTQTAAESEIQRLYDELSGSAYLDDQKSFQAFREHGFHATSDLLEISSHFIQLLSQISGAKLFVECSDRSRRPDLTVNKSVALLELRLAETILRKYRWADQVCITFEENSALDGAYGRIVKSAASRAGYRGRATSEIGQKMNPHTLSIVDYAVVCYGRSQRPHPADFQIRAWNAIRPMVSSIRCLDRGGVEMRRGLIGE